MSVDLNQETRDAVREMIETDIIHLPDQLGVDHIIPGCEVVNLDPYAVGLGVFPRYIKVKINEYHLDAFYRGGISTLAVGTLLNVTHLSVGDRYEVTGVGGSTGIATSGHTPRAWLSETLPYLDFTPDNPAVVTVAGVVTEYATIVAAITAAVAGNFVVIPPGAYDEALTLKNGVIITELFPGTVTINSVSANIAVTCADGGYIRVREISVTRNTGAPVIAVYGNNVPTGGTICTVLAEKITVTNASVGAASYAIGIYPNTMAGTLYVYAKRMVITGAKYAYSILELASSGILEVFIDNIVVNGADVSYLVRLTITTTLTCNFHNGKYTVTGSGAVACYNIYNGSGTINIWSCDLFIVSAGDAYGLYISDAGTVNLDSVNIYAYTAAGTAYCEITNHASAVLNHRHGRCYAQGSTNGYGITCTNGTVRVTDATAYGNTTDLVRTAGTFSIASVQYDTYSGTIVLIDESIHALIAELDDTTELTIAGGAVTITQSYHRVDTENGDASDDLDTINGGVIGRLLVLRPEDGARTVVVKHNIGNIWFLGGADVTLDDINDHIMLIYDGTKWCSVDEDGAGGGGGAPHDFLSATHSDTVASAVTRGDIVVGTAGGWDDLAVGTAQQLLQVNASATDPAWTSFDWDNMAAGAGADMVHDHSAAGEGGAVDTSVITYTPAVAADWDGGADPGNADDAFDQLAERVEDLEAGGGGGAPTDYPYLGFGTDAGLSAEVNSYDFLGSNLIKNSPGQIFGGATDGAEPLWWDDVANATLTDEDATGEGITVKFKRVFKVVTIANDVYGYQTLTFADEELLNAGVAVVSLGVWVYCASASVASVAIYGTNLGLQESAQHTGGAGWELLTVENITLNAADTSIQVRLICDTGTAYFAAPMLNIGPRSLPWRVRDVKHITKNGVNQYDLNPTGDVAWSTIDCTANTHNLCVAIDVHAAIFEPNGTIGSYHRIGPALAITGADFPIISVEVAVFGVTTKQTCAYVECDDSQNIRYQVGEQDADSDVRAYLNIVGYWMWG